MRGSARGGRDACGMSKRATKWIVGFVGLSAPRGQARARVGHRWRGSGFLVRPIVHGSGRGPMRHLLGLCMILVIGAGVVACGGHAPIRAASLVALDARTGATQWTARTDAIFLEQATVVGRE